MMENAAPNATTDPSPEAKGELQPNERQFIADTERTLGEATRIVYQAVHTHTYKSTAAIARQVKRPEKYESQRVWQTRVAGILGDLRKRGLVVSKPKQHTQNELLWLKTVHRLLIPQTSTRNKRPRVSTYRTPGGRREELVDAHKALGELENHLRATLDNVTAVREALQGLDGWEKELHARAAKIQKATEAIKNL